MKTRMILSGFSFESAHKLENYRGKCADLHGHSYKLEVTAEGKVDNKTGMIVDFKSLKSMIKHILIEPYDHKYLNNLFDFNPTAENMANYMFCQLSRSLEHISGTHIKLISLKLWETEHNCVEVVGD